MPEIRKIIDSLKENKDLDLAELGILLGDIPAADEEYLYASAREVRESVYGKDVYLRGLIEFTNYCKNDCYYCGIRKSNKNANRYRLSEEEILGCCEKGYDLGFRTFVLQGGEDPYYTDEKICTVVAKIRRMFPDCAITLSIGEKSKESYKKFFDAGAERYLLRHETANKEHYSLLHPARQSIENRKRCLFDLKEIGYQTGCGIMVGSPYQTTEHIYEDIKFMQGLCPEMIGIGPFLPHHDTPFYNKPAGTADQTLRLLAILRLIFPNALLPATTALGTIDPHGREKGLLAGANVVMPNLSPAVVCGKYLLYDGKICTGDEAAECVGCMRTRIESVGYKAVVSRGDYKEL